MKKVLYLSLFVANIFYCSKVESFDKPDPSSPYVEEYSYSRSDKAQLKQAVGMTITGVVMFIAIGLISGLIPVDSDASPTTFDDPSTDNTIIN